MQGNGRLEEKDFDDLMRETDTSGDGEIDFQEFVAMLANTS